VPFFIKTAFPDSFSLPVYIMALTKAVNIFLGFYIPLPPLKGELFDTNSFLLQTCLHSWNIPSAVLTSSP
jgi:hypothetical protein